MSTLATLLLAMTSSFADVAPPADPPLFPELKAAWDEARRDATWSAPTLEERLRFAFAWQILISNADTCDDDTLDRARDVLAEADLVVDVLEAEGSRVLLIHEGTVHRGAGLYAMRCGPADPVVWQAPHSFHDERTGFLIRWFFTTGRPRVAMWNTIHRYKALPGEKPEDPFHPADVTRQSGSLFQAATFALAIADCHLRFVQVHGFDDSSADFDAIVSTGREEDPPQSLATLLSPILGRVAAYGLDAEELGGTLNVQGHLLNWWPSTRFLHMELSASTRARLATDADLRASLREVVEQEDW